MKKREAIQRRESLMDIARQAGILVPNAIRDERGYRLGYLDQNGYDPSVEEFPHWSLYCLIQIDRPIPSDDALLHNAQIVAAIPIERLNSSEFRFEEISSQLK